jgi:AAHS family 4-hydroxybenzoate transporter-like MFS transporter
MSSKGLDLEAIVDRSSFGASQRIVVILCALVTMVDGFATQSIAFVAPEIAQAWRISPSMLGLVFGAGLFGSLLGALGFGAIGDRFGRKPALFLSVLVFAIITLATPLTHSALVLTILRLATGLGLGGALPAAIALTSEYAPSRLRTTAVGLMFCGFPLGAVVGGAISARLIPAYGWESTFYVAGVAALILLPAIVLLLPESVRFLLLRSDRDAIQQTLRRMGWLELWDGETGAVSAAAHSPVASLFAEGRAAGTLLLWTTLFLSLLLTYFLINWIPLIVRQVGIGAASAVLAVVAINSGAIVGCLVLSRISDRVGHVPSTIAGGFALGAVAIAALGFATQSGPMLVSVAFLAGALSVGAQMCAVVYCASFYETRLRATGVGWAIGVGRAGSIVGPVLGGVLMSANVPLRALFVLIAFMSLGAAASMLALGRTTTLKITGRASA